MVMAVQSRLDEGAGNRITFDIAVCGLLRFGKNTATIPIHHIVYDDQSSSAPV
jgi:hypothetical protein